MQDMGGGVIVYSNVQAEIYGFMSMAIAIVLLRTDIG